MKPGIIITRKCKGSCRFFFLFCFSLFAHIAGSQQKLWFSELGVNLSYKQDIVFNGTKTEKTATAGYLFSINKGGRKIAVGLHLECTPVKTGEMNTEPVKKNSLTLWEYYLGVRYYPILPTFRLGSFGAVRFTAGCFLGGYNYYWKEKDNYSYPSFSHRAWSAVKGSSLLFAGFCFSSFRNSSGLSLRLNYKPARFEIENPPLQDFTLQQHFSLSGNLFIGARIKSKKSKK